MPDCVYFGDRLDGESHACQLHERCVPTDGGRKEASCDTCGNRLCIGDKDFPSKWIDPLAVVDREKRQTDSIRDLLIGNAAFLVCSGPSTLDLPLEELGKRGVFTLAVNNAAAALPSRPQAFVCSDPPMKFHQSIWLDPGTMKFVPMAKMRGGRSKLREKRGGVFKRMRKRVCDCPNVWGFQRESWFEPDDSFFLSKGACWGNHKVGVERTGREKTVCTMFLGMRLLRYLGARRIYLLGVDFRMSPDYGYSFKQDRDEGASQSNNRQFAVVNGWLCEMQHNRVFERFGLEVYNCFERSGLRAFPHVPFDAALEDARAAVAERIDLAGWYEKAHCEKCGSWHVRWGQDLCECLDCGLVWDPKESCPGCNSGKIQFDLHECKCKECGLVWGARKLEHNEGGVGQ